MKLACRFDVSDSLIGKVRRDELYKTRKSCRGQEASDRAGWALAFYTGMRRSEIRRGQWPHVFWEADEIMVAASKSEAGEGRRIPMVGPLKTILRQEWIRQGQPKSGPIVTRSVESGKWQARADEVWEKAKLNRITLHEARHAYARFLMAAGYTTSSRSRSTWATTTLAPPLAISRTFRFQEAQPSAPSSRRTSQPRSAT